jgi:hypothetical protein
MIPAYIVAPAGVRVSSSSPLKNTAHGGHVLDVDRELERYCRVCGFPPPVFNVDENKSRFLGRVSVGGVEYFGYGDQPSAVVAKKNAALVALASIGVQALRLQEQGIRCMVVAMTEATRVFAVPPPAYEYSNTGESCNVSVCVEPPNKPFPES